jgi:LMBR1 domain-containing protein 1
MKYTVFTLIAGILIIVLALVLRFGVSSSSVDKWTWIKNIIDFNNFGDRAIGFMVACLALIGLIPFNIYTSYGLAALPISLMKRTNQLNSEISGVQDQIDYVSDKLRLLNSKYEMRGEEMNKKDKKEYQKLKNQLNELQRKNRRFDQVKSSWSLRIEPFIYPIKFFIGVILLLATILVLTSLIITQIDRAIYSECKIWCGFVLNKVHPWNPLDRVLTYSSIVFPVDYVLFGLFIGLIMLGSVVGLSNIGIRFLFIKLYKIKYRRTMPQGLLTACIFLMFIITVFSFMLLSFAPQYSTFGSQKYQTLSGSWVECDLSALYNGTSPIFNITLTKDLVLAESDFLDGPTSRQAFEQNYIGRPCYMTQLATMVNNVAFRVPIFSAIFYFSNWFFVGMYILFFLIALFRKPAAILNAEDSDDEMDDEISRSQRQPHSEQPTPAPRSHQISYC